MSEGKLIAVAAEDSRGLDGEVGAHFGRCPYYVLAKANGDKATEFQVVVANPHFDSHQPGLMPQFIRGLGTDVIIAGGMGPRAIEMFHGFGIEVATGATGTVGEVLGAYLRGEYREVVPCSGGHGDGCGGQSPEA